MLISPDLWPKLHGASTHFPVALTRVLCWAALAGSFSLGTAFSLGFLIGGQTDSAPASIPRILISTTAERVVQGKQYYSLSCSQCHGEDARGDEGPDLHNLPLSPARMATIIRKGIKNQMPPFAQKYDSAQIAALVLYLRTLK